MKCYASPYEGAEDFLFFSYCHEDASRVYPIIERLAIEGFHVWYDDGIHPGEDWPQVIAEHLSAAKVCVAAVSRASAESHNCRNEVSFAVANNKPFLSIVLEDFMMPLGMKLQLSSSRFLKLYEWQGEAFYSELFTAPFLNACRTPGAHADGAALDRWRRHTENYARQEEKASPVKEPDTPDDRWFGANVNPEGGKQKKPAAVEASGVIPKSGDKNIPPDKKPVSAQKNPGMHGKPETPAVSAGAEPGKNKAEQQEDENKTVIIGKTAEKSPEAPTVMNIASMPALLVRAKTGEIFPIKNAQTVIGRARSKSDLVVSGNNAISGSHIAIYKSGSRFTLHNLNPTNETLVDGRKLAHEESIGLSPGAEIILADEQFFLLFGDACDRVFDDQKIYLLRSRETGETKLLTGDSLPLNRNHPWSGRLLSDPRISRVEHAEIRREHGRLYLRDLGSKNGTFLNGKRLNPKEGAELHDRDVIAVVDTEFQIHEIKMGAK